MTLEAIAQALGCEFRGDGSTEIESAATIETAGAGQISFVANSLYMKYINTTEASALILSENVEFDRLPTLRDKNPYLIFARVIQLLYPDDPPIWGIASSAVVSADAELDDQVSIGEFCVVEAGAKIGSGCVIGSHSVVGKDAVIGKRCRLHQRVVVRERCSLGDDVILQTGVVIGGDGFGYARSSAGYTRVKQTGTVIIGDRVEMGVNCAVDRGVLGATVVGAGTKVDNLVQIAHNVEIGVNCIIVAQVGISGSAVLGNWVTLAGQVGVVGHLKIGDGAIATAQAGITKDVEPGTTVFGFPAREIRSGLKITAASSQLPGLIKRVKKLEKELEKAQKLQ